MIHFSIILKLNLVTLQVAESHNVMLVLCKQPVVMITGRFNKLSQIYFKVKYIWVAAIKFIKNLLDYHDHWLFYLLEFGFVTVVKVVDMY